MTLVKWTPRPMTVFNEVDNMINSVFNRDWNLEPIQSTKWNPAVDVKETDSSFLISADIPGLTKKDINIEYADNLLTIKSVKDSNSAKKDSESGVLHKGISKRFFSKTFTIADDTEVKSAELKDGLLKVSLERIIPEAKKPKVIKIQ